jgi:hypothetical protein
MQDADDDFQEEMDEESDEDEAFGDEIVICLPSPAHSLLPSSPVCVVDVLSKHCLHHSRFHSCR